MLRLLMSITRVSAFQDTGLDAHALLGQTMLPDFLDQSLNHARPTLRLDQTQRDQVLIQDVQGRGETDARRGDGGRVGGPQHQGALP